MESNSDFKADAQKVSRQALDYIRNKRGISPATCLAVVILFAFPFMNITCNGQKVSSVTGTSLIVGNHSDTAADSDKTGELLVRIPAVLGFLGALGGALLFFYKGEDHMYEALGIATAGIGLYGLKAVRSSWAMYMMAAQDGYGQGIGVSFTTAYWLAILLLHAAIAFSVYRLVKLPSKEQVPVHT
jgi:hypothetical protein